MKSKTDSKLQSPREVQRPLRPEEAFQHKPLDSGNRFRLMRLYRMNDHDLIHCELIERTIGDAPQYHALSYCWGTATDKTPIVCDDKLLLVSCGLHDALLRLLDYQDRPEVGSTYHWCDQICIDQGNVREREAQVQQMAKIYRGALRTMVYLGEFDEKVTRRLFTHFLTPFLESIRRYTGGDIRWEPDNEEQRSARYDGYFHDIRMPQLCGPEINALIALIERPWWYRIWCVQEIALSSTDPFLMCGDIVWSMGDLVALEHFFRLFDSFWTESPLTLVCLLFNRIKTVHIESITWDIRALLPCVHRMLSTDPRDKILAILGLISKSSDENPLVVQVDYEKPPVELYRDLTRDIVSRSGDLSILLTGGFVGHCQQANFPCALHPCWVPRWDSRDANRSKNVSGLDLYLDTAGCVQRKLPWGDASGRQKHIMSDLEDRNTLGLQGIRIDSVSWTANRFGSEPDDPTALDIWEIILQHLGLEPYFDQKYLEVAQSFLGALRCGINRSNETLLTKKRLEGFWRWLADVYQDDSGAKRQIPPSLLRGYQAHASSEFIWRPAFLSGTRFFVSRDRRVCLGPWGLEPGDEIFVVFGSRVPLALRQCGNEYHLIGEVYVPDIMDGEIAKEWREGKWVSEEIILR